MSDTLSYYHQLTQFYTLYSAWNIVKSKAKYGGIDKVSIEDFECNEKENIESLALQIKNKTYTPEPYFKVLIPKNEKEKRELGLLTIQDKVIQTAIKTLIEPLFEQRFVNVSYAYRPGKGAVKAVNRVRNTIHEQKAKFMLSVDIDHFFDTIQHELLFIKLKQVIKEDELLHLIRLCISIGKVDKDLRWTDVDKGVPQGAVLSPLLANWYLHELDTWAVKQKIGYIRYADDFVLLLRTEKQATHYAQHIKNVLKSRFFLSPNDKFHLKSLDDGFEYLGILITKNELKLSERKKERLIFKIKEATKISHLYKLQKLEETIRGIKSFYGALLKQEELIVLDEIILHQIDNIIRNTKEKVKPKDFLNGLLKIQFISDSYNQSKKEKIQDELIRLKWIEHPKKKEIVKKIDKKKENIKS